MAKFSVASFNFRKERELDTIRMDTQHYVQIVEHSYSLPLTSLWL